MGKGIEGFKEGGKCPPWRGGGPEIVPGGRGKGIFSVNFFSKEWD